MEMTELEKVIEGLCDAIGIIHGYVPKRYWGYGEQACRDAIELLKEQEDLGTELGNAVELIHKKNERIEKLLKEQETSNLYKCPNCGTWVSAENVVRCKDCKHLSSPANGVPFCKHIKKFVDADWFCADGERAKNAR